MSAGYSQDSWVVIVDGNGCIVPGCNTVGITEQATNLLDAFSIFPNPAHGSATVQLSLPPSVSGALELTLVAMDGRVFARERLPNGSGSFPLSLSLSLGPRPVLRAHRARRQVVNGL
ncbi:MAG: hypothetical protein IPI81_08020 [Flavobacteriales bacterium]|nr:hypothetical protein [Flavobacteriales bacterium]MCC6938411.1 hypothetical protein [Flavobacteriales bacterium]